MVPWAMIAQKIAGAAGSTAQFAAPIAQSLGKAATQQRKLIHSDTEAMKQGKLGYSDAKKRRMLEMSLRQQASAMGPEGMSSSQRAAASASAMQGINTDSEQTAILRRADILRRLKEQAARNSANWAESTSHVGGMLGADQKGGGGGDIGGMASSLGSIMGK